MKQLIFLSLFCSQVCLAWGEVGHHLIARAAVEVLRSHPALHLTDGNETQTESLNNFLRVFTSKQIQEGHLANIPDTYWRSLDLGLEEAGDLLGSPTHYFDSEKILVLSKAVDFSIIKIPLNYQQVKKDFSGIHNLFTELGTLPWRAEQFTQLYSNALKANPKVDCNNNKTAEAATRNITTYAGLLAHFTGDVTMPYHTSLDHDAISVGQKGIHGYFERDLVNELELSGLFGKVVTNAEKLLQSPTEVESTPSIIMLRQKAKENYPEQTSIQESTAVMMEVIRDSFSLIEKLRQLDYTYAIASLEEAMKRADCKGSEVVKELAAQFETLETKEQRSVFEKVKVLSIPSGYQIKKTTSACRRSPSTRVTIDGELSKTGKTVAEWHEALIVNRLALSAALTADIWVREWLRHQRTNLCATFLYAHKPSFISPTDANCSGYALKESAKDFLKTNGKSVLPFQKISSNQNNCLSF